MNTERLHAVFDVHHRADDVLTKLQGKHSRVVGCGTAVCQPQNHPVRNLYPLPVLVPLPLPLLVRLQERYKTNENS